MRLLIVSAALAGFALFSLPAAATTVADVTVDNSVVEKKCKRGYGKNSAGKCVKIPRGSGGTKKRGSH